jgi:FkbM family methyltransferase
VGAHRGEDTLLYLLKGFRVVAVEANPDLVAGIQRDFAPAIQSGQLTIVDKIMADRSFEKRNFYVDTRQSLWGSTHNFFIQRSKEFGHPIQVLSVETISLLDLVSVFGVPYYLKVDIEGNDLLCIQQLANIPEAERPHYVSIESARTKYPWEHRREFKVFRELGYDAFQVVPQHRVAQQQIPRPPREGAPVPDNYQLQHDMTGLFGKDLPPGDWLSARDACRQYQKIFWQQWLNGDEGILTGLWKGDKRHKIQRLWEGVLEWEAGWHDTHARRRSVS